MKWPDELALGEDQLLRCPGDGNCLWHACYLWHAGHPQDLSTLAAQGAEFKRSTMAAITQKVGEHAQLWGSAPQGVQAALQEWTHDWADARALLSISYELGVDIMLLDGESRMIEVISAEGDLQGAKPMWILHFRKDHYDAVKPQTPQAVAAVCNAIQLQPWRHADQNPQKRGGAHMGNGRDCRFVIEMFARRLVTNFPRHDPETGEIWRWESLRKTALLHFQHDLPPGWATFKLAHLKGTDEDTHIQDMHRREKDLVVSLRRDPPPRSTGQDKTRYRKVTHIPRRFRGGLQRYNTYKRRLKQMRRSREARIVTWNMGGWKAQTHALQHMMKRDAIPTIYLLQETHLKSIQMHRAHREMNQLGMRILEGQHEPWIKTGKGMRGDMQGCPGVACVYPAHIQLYPVAPLTPEGKRAYESGRLQLLHLMQGHDPPLLLVNLYAPAGHGKTQQRMAFYDEVYAEIAAQNHEKCIVGGDFNAMPNKNALAAKLLPRGWRCPTLRTPRRRGQKREQYTYKAGESKTWIDGFLIGSRIMKPIRRQQVCRETPTQHSPVEIVYTCVKEERWPQVRPPPRVKLREETESQEAQDWGALREMHQAIYSLPVSGRWETQSLMDEIWQTLEEAHKSELKHSMTLTEKDASRLGRIDLDWHPNPTHHRSKGKAVASTVMRMQGHVYRLQAYRDNGASRAYERLQRARAEIQEHLRMDEDEFDAALLEPHRYVEAWHMKVKQYAKEQAQKGIERWKQTLWAQNRPQPALYRWIRGMPPPATLAVRSEDRLECGPRAFFATMRTYWKAVMCRDPEEQAPLDKWMDDHPQPWEPATDEEIEALRTAIKTLAPRKAAGLDCWTPETVRAYSKGLTPCLADFYKWCESTALWPTPWTRVRTQLCPKTRQPEPQPGDFRPIAILTVWFRLWSRWRLLLTDPSVLSKFPGELCGGLPSRTPQGRMLRFMLRIEQLIHEAAVSGSQQHLLFVSLDASKCFDRVIQHKTLEDARLFGLPLPALRGIGAHMRQLVRHFSCGGALDPNPVVPTSGLLQGDPYSVILCNVVVMTWVRETRREGVESTAFIDDRFLYSMQERESCNRAGRLAESGSKRTDGSSTSRKRRWESLDGGEGE